MTLKKIEGRPKKENQSLKLDRELTTVAKGAGATFIGKLSRTGLQYFSQVVIARLLGIELFGIYALGIVLYQLGEIFSSMGLQSGIVRFVSIHRSTNNIKKLKGVMLQAIKFPFFAGLVLSAAFFLASKPIAQDLFRKPDLTAVIRIFAIAIPFGASMTVAALATTGFQTTRYFVYIRGILQPLTNLLLVVLVGGLSFGLRGVATAWVVATILGLAAALCSLRRLFPPLFQKNVKAITETAQLLRFSFPLAFGGFLGFILLWMDTLMLGFFRPSSEVGIYRAASQTAILLMIILNSLNIIFSPMIAELFDKKDLKKMEKIFQVTTRWCFSLTIPLFLIVALAGNDILRIFGPGFELGWMALLILSAGQLINAGTGGIGYMLIMSEHQYLKLLGDILLVVMNIILNILLIPRWGLTGAAAATAISIAGVNILRGLQVYFILNIQAYNWSYLKPLSAGIISVLIGFATQHWLPPVHFLLSLSIKSGVIIIIYALLLWSLHLDEGDKAILKKIMKKLKLL